MVMFVLVLVLMLMFMGMGMRLVVAWRRVGRGRSGGRSGLGVRCGSGVVDDFNAALEFATSLAATAAEPAAVAAS